ncbi:MAG: aminopeptidase P family N-terminal domain-containing protein [Desulfobulbaceae bacterium]
MDEIFRKRVVRCTDLMQKHDLEALILTKPANMLYLTGDGRLCAYAMVTRDGQVAMGVPQTDIEDAFNNNLRRRLLCSSSSSISRPSRKARTLHFVNGLQKQIKHSQTTKALSADGS